MMKSYLFPLLIAIIAAFLSVFYPHHVQKIQRQVVASVQLFVHQAYDPPPLVKKNCTASEYLTIDADVKGFHILCLSRNPDTGELQTTAYLHGRAVQIETFTSPAQETVVGDDYLSYRAAVERATDMIPPHASVDPIVQQYKQHWTFFTPEGIRMNDMSALEAAVTVFVFEGGQFIWPGVRVGHRFRIPNLDAVDLQNYPNDVVFAETLSLQPLVFRIEEFLTDAECALIIELSLPHLKPSSVALMDKDKGKKATEWRTSSTYFLSTHAHAQLHVIDRRVEQLTKVDKSHFEEAQVLRYEINQKYDAHHDFFSPHAYRENAAILESIHHGHKNRMITVFWYMSDVEEGGETGFPRAGGLPRPSSFVGCHQGLKVKPKKRSVVVFYSLLPNGEPDEYSLHGGCPVVQGEKFAVNKWVWNKPR